MVTSPLALPVPPATGGWQEGDPPGRRSWVTLRRPAALESGNSLPGVRLAYETWGSLATDGANAVLVLHALTGDSHVAGPAGPGHPTAGWWDALIGPGRALDTDRWFVVAPNVLVAARAAPARRHGVRAELTGAATSPI